MFYIIISFLTIFLFGFLGIRAVIIVCKSNLKTHTVEWRQDRCIEWLMRPLPNTKIDIGIRQDKYEIRTYPLTDWIGQLTEGWRYEYAGRVDLPDYIWNYEHTGADVEQLVITNMFELNDPLRKNHKYVSAQF